MSRTYEPKAGTMLAGVLKWIRSRPIGEWMQASSITRGCNLESSKDLRRSLELPIKRGLVEIRIGEHGNTYYRVPCASADSGAPVFSIDWPPRFVAQLPDLMRQDLITIRNSAAQSARRASALASDDAATRHKALGALHGLSGKADKLIAQYVERGRVC